MQEPGERAGVRSPQSTRLASSTKLATHSSSSSAERIPERSLGFLSNATKVLDFLCISELSLHNKSPQKLVA